MAQGGSERPGHGCQGGATGFEPGGPYATGEVESLLGLGEHVFRYWEKRLPFLSPARSNFGRRAWSPADLALLLRVRHLVRGKGLSLEQATDQLINERTGAGAENAARLALARASLIDCYMASLRLRARAERSLGKVRSDQNTARPL